MVFQDFKLLNDRTIFENVALPLQIEGVKGEIITDKVKNILSRINMNKQSYKYPEELSGGEQQKVCVARALVKNPKIIVADEPTGNLDPSSSDDIIDLLENESKRGTTIIMATHNYPLIENRIEHFIEFNNGKVIDWWLNNCYEELLSRAPGINCWWLFSIEGSTIMRTWFPKVSEVDG